MTLLMLLIGLAAHAAMAALLLTHRPTDPLTHRPTNAPPMHPTQHSTLPPAASLAVNTMTNNLRDLIHARMGRGLHIAPAHAEVLRRNQTHQLQPRPAPMPQR